MWKSRYRKVLKLCKNKVGSLITQDVGHIFLPALVGDHLLLSFIISDPTLIPSDTCFRFSFTLFASLMISKENCFDLTSFKLRFHCRIKDLRIQAFSFKSKMHENCHLIWISTKAFIVSLSSKLI